MLMRFSVFNLTTSRTFQQQKQETTNSNEMIVSNVEKINPETQGMLNLNMRLRSIKVKDMVKSSLFLRTYVWFGGYGARHR